MKSSALKTRCKLLGKNPNRKIGFAAIELPLHPVEAQGWLRRYRAMTNAILAQRRPPVFESADPCAAVQTLDPVAAARESAADLRLEALHMGLKAASPT